MDSSQQPAQKPDEFQQQNLPTQPQSEILTDSSKPTRSIPDPNQQIQPQPVDQGSFQTPRIDNKPETQKLSGQQSGPNTGKANLETLESEKKILEQLISLLEQMKEKLHTRAEAFKALDTEGTGKIKKQQFADLLASEGIGDENSVDLFDKIAENGIITEKNWNEAWATTTFKLQQFEHQIKMITQKQAISKALESPISSSRIEQSIPQEESKIEGSKFQSIIDKCRNTSSLGDLSDIFTSLHISSPQRREPIGVIPELLSTQLNFELPKPKSKADVRFSLFQTPSKEDELPPSQEVTGRASYLRSDVEPRRIPQESLRGSLGSRNRSPVSLISSKNPILSLRLDVNSKIQQTMSLNYEAPKEIDRFNNKTNKRKDDLSQYMAKLGLGGEPRGPLEKPLRDANLRTQVDKMRQILFSQQPIVPTQKSGLTTLLTDPKFSQSSFRHGPRGSHDSKGGRSESQGKDTYSLLDQSLKNYTLKLIHKHKYGGEKEGDNRMVSPQKRFGHSSIINY